MLHFPFRDRGNRANLAPANSRDRCSRAHPGLGMKREVGAP